MPLAALDDDIGNFFDAVGVVLRAASREIGFGSAAARARCLRRLPDAALAGVLPRPARGLPDERIAVPADLGRVRRRLRVQQRRPGARRRRHQAVPDEDVGPATRPIRRSARRSSSRRSSTRRWASSSSRFAFTQGVFPKPPDFAKLNAFDLIVLRVAPAVHALPAHGARLSAGSSAFAVLLRARAGLLGARAPGADDPARPPALLPRGLPRAARGLVLPLRRVLVPARGVQRRRLGEERPARAGRQRGRRGRALHARRRGRAAGASSSRSSPGRRRPRRSPPTPSASRSPSPPSAWRSGSRALVTIFRFRSFREVLRAGREARDADRAAASA